MRGLYKRKNLAFILALIFIAFPFFISCTNQSEGDKDGKEEFSGLIVHYIDVGEGDATLICLPNGKRMLIDCGSNLEDNYEKVRSFIEKYGNELEYLLLTHTDEEHFGNAKDILNNFKVKTAIIPYVLNTSTYPSFSEIVNLINAKQIKTEVSRTGLNLSSDNYTLLLLSPDKVGENSSYHDFNLSTIPNDNLADDICPIIYLEYKGITFLFTGDVGNSQESLVLQNYSVGLYDNYLGSENKITLENLDFYKVSSHGSSRGNGEDFLGLLSPKNAIISVGGSNGKGNPQSKVLLRLHEANPNYNLYRTDRDKTVSVFVKGNGECEVITNN